EGHSGTDGVASVRPLDPAPLRRLGVRIVELRRQAGATAITVRTTRPAWFLKHRGVALTHAIDHVHVGRGPFCAVGGGHGSVVAAWGFLPSEGMLVTRPDLQECSPVQPISMPIGAVVPHCAAR